MRKISSKFLFWRAVWATSAIILLNACAFQPRVVNVQNAASNISLPIGNFDGSFAIQFDPVLDRRPNKTDFGVIRNKLMMVTAPVSMTGSLSDTVENLVKKNFDSVGIEPGESPLVVRTEILEAHTDLPGPDHLFVRIRLSLSVVDQASNAPVFSEVFTGYSVVGVIQLGNVGHERAFVEAMNQISEQVHRVAVSVNQYFVDGGGGTSDGGEFLAGSGTGFFVSGNGLVITNHHVIDGAEEIIVFSEGGKSFPAKVVQSSPSTDLALLKVDHESQNYLSFAPQNSSHIGDKVFTLGFPMSDILGENVKYSEGVINSLSGVGGDSTFLQISVPIQPGNSGGPLINLDGDVVGIITSSAAVEYFFKASGGALPQNVNWAVKGEYASLMIKPTGKQSGTSSNEVIEAAKKSVVLIQVK